MTASSRPPALVSIILPVFNGEATVEQAIQSALAQTESALELIVIDDRSTDRTSTIIDRIASEDERVRVLRLSENQGPAAARNAGLAIATGRWAATLDADDLYHPERLARLLALAEDQGADMVSDNLLVQPIAGDAYPLIPRTSLPQARNLTLTEFMLRNSDTTHDAVASYGFLQPMIRRDFLDRRGLNTILPPDLAKTSSSMCTASGPAHDGSPRQSHITPTNSVQTRSPTSSGRATFVGSSGLTTSFSTIRH